MKNANFEKNKHHESKKVDEKIVDKELDSTKKQDVNVPDKDEQEPQDVEKSEKYLILKESLLRALAENENLRKRFDKEKEDLLKYSISKFALDMLTIPDNLQRALDNIPDIPENKSIRDGIVMTQTQTFSTFKKHGVEKIDTKPGDTFNSAQHQAMLEEEGTNLSKGSISKIMQDGYTLNQRLLRPALVAVAK